MKRSQRQWFVPGEQSLAERLHGVYVCYRVSVFDRYMMDHVETCVLSWEATSERSVQSADAVDAEHLFVAYGQPFACVPHRPFALLFLGSSGIGTIRILLQHPSIQRLIGNL